MIAGKRVVVIMPAYNAERTIEITSHEVLAQDVVDLVIVLEGEAESLSSRGPELQREGTDTDGRVSWAPKAKLREDLRSPSQY